MRAAAPARAAAGGGRRQQQPKVAAGAHPLEPQQQQQQQQQHGIPLRLNGRAVSILWDLDNTDPSSLQLDLLPAVQELQVLLTRLGGCVSHTALYANPATCRRLGASRQQQLAAAGVQLVQVPLRNQAADMQLAADAYAFARQQQRQGCIVCVSGDTDFAPILSYVAGQGAVAISMSAVASSKRLPHLLPDLRQQALPQACHAVLAWQPAAGAAARKQQQQQQIASSQVKHHMVVSTTTSSSSSSSGSSPGVTTSAGRVILAGSGWHAVAAAGEAAAAVDAQGGPAQFIEAAWINPNKALEQQQQQQQQQHLSQLPG
uniref:NYN domain-containing protein n=1 Tax=Tetradesmus obliquus TaxID=3088 RepID=A0A383V7U3_TETOB|eukprot:jgi/Sobl393_1/7382/SZX61655.1